MTISLERGILQKVANENYDGPITIAVSGLAKNSANRLIGTASDGENSFACNFPTKFSNMYDQKKLASHDIIKASSYQATNLNGVTNLVLLDVEVLGKYAGPALPACTPSRAAEKNVDFKASTPRPTPSEARSQMTPGAKESSPSSFTFLTPGSALLTPAAASPKAFAASSAGRASALPKAAEKAHQPISALNPYQSKWTIKAKLERKQDKRSINGKDGLTSVFTCTLTDEHGTQIEGTFWAEVADAMYDKLQEGLVYYVSNGALSPSNRKYSTVNNDYKITFKANTVIEEAKDQDASKMKAAYTFIAIDCLAARIGKKLPVDCVGIVTSVSPMASVKRAADGTELARRDITVVDRSLRSVVVTLWRETAEQVGGALEALSNPVLVMGKMRVTDFNGVSVSQAYASTFEIEPTSVPEAAELRKWWDSEGSSQTFAPAGDSAARKAGGGRGSNALEPLEAIMPAADRVVLPDDKPTFHSLRCTIANIDEEQSLYYMANTENLRKVVEQNGKYWCEHDSKLYDTMQRRYVMNMQVTDFTGQQHINVFNDQAEQILGDTADAIGDLKETNQDEFAGRLKKPRWSEWIVDIMAKPKEYNGNTRMRLNVRTARRVDFAADAAHLIQAIAAALK